MIGGMGSAVTPDLSKGGEIDGDLVITGDFKVEGAGSFAYDEIVEGTLQVTGSNAYIDVLDTDSSLKVTMRGGDSVGAIGTYSNHPLSIRTNSTEAIRITSAGLVGIGTASPSGALSVKPNEDATIELGRTKIYSAVSDYMYLSHYDMASMVNYALKQNSAGATVLNAKTGSTIGLSINNSNKLTVSGNNIGIGTTSPSTKLHVKGANDNSNGQLKLESTGTDARIHFINSSGDSSTSGNADILMSATSGYEGLRFMIDNSDKMIIDENGNVGIGTTSPSVPLHISTTSTNPLLLENTTQDASGGAILNKIAFKHNATLNTSKEHGSIGYYAGEAWDDTKFYQTIINGGSPQVIAENHRGNTWKFFTAGNQVLTINSSGNVGIGTASPSTMLHVASGAIRLDSSQQLQLGGASTHIDGDSGHMSFDVNSGKRFKLDGNSRISLSNNDGGTDNTVFGDNAGNNIASGGNQNTFFGDYAGHSNTTGDDNTYIGKSAGQANSGTGDDNTFVGSFSGYQLTGGSSNTAVGKSSLQAITTSSSNTAVGAYAGDAINTGSSNSAFGKSALTTNTNGIRNTAIGETSMQDNLSGGYNVAVGRESLLRNVTGGQNTAVGHSALSGANGQSHSNNTAVGYFALGAVTTGSANTGVGQEVLKAITIGQYNVAMGENALRTEDVGNFTTAIGYRAGYSQNSDSNNEDTGNTLLGAGAGFYNVTGTNNTLIGRQSGNGASGQSNSNNTAVGYQSLYAITTGGTNVAVGSNAMLNANTASNNVSIGFESAKNITIGGHNIAIGRETLVSEDVGNISIGIGSYALFSQNSDSNNEQSGNISIGYSSSYYNATGTNNTALGSFAMQGASGQSNSNNTAVGYQSMYPVTTGGNNTALGYQSLRKITSGGQNTGIGTQANYQVTTGVVNTAVGNGSLFYNQTGNYNTAIGGSAMGGASGESHSNNTAVGYKSMLSVTTGSGNTAVGTSSLEAITSASNNIAVGMYAGYQITDGHSNVLIGGSAGENLSTNTNHNVMVGYQSGEHADGASIASVRNSYLGYQSGRYLDDGIDNVAIGYQALYGNSAEGNDASNNVAVGKDSLKAITDGDNNVAIGSSALSKSTTASNNVAIGKNSMLDITTGQRNVALGSYTMAMNQSGNGAKTSNDNVFIGYNVGGGSWTAYSSQYNVAIGSFALNHNLNGANQNVVIGYKALTVGTTVGGNVALGYQAMLTTTDADNCVFIGTNAGAGVITSAGNGTVGIGHSALTALTSGAENTAIGYEALKTQTTTSGNTALGYRAGHKITTSGSSTAIGAFAVGGASGSSLTGNNNTGIGRYALADIYDASQSNTAVGNQTLEEVTTGSFNTGLGAYAGDNLTTGAGNTYLGYYALPSAVDVADEIVLKAGIDALAGGGTETIRIGVDSDFITNDFGENATWTHSSDKRIKKDIEDSALGLDFINDLRPVTFKKKAPSEYPQEFEQYNASTTERKNPDRKHYGFIAQEVKEAMDNAGHSEFPVWKENRDGMQELGETELITPLIKAVQELSAEVKQLKQQLEDK